MTYRKPAATAVTTATLLVTATIVACSIAAGPASRPATRPTSRPAAPALTPRDSFEVSSEKYRLSFRVPKTWEKRDATVSGGEAEIFAYGMTMPPNRNASAPPVNRYLTILAGKPCTPGETLEELAKSMRESIARNAGSTPVTLTRDEATTVAGLPAWRLEFPSEQEFTVTNTDGKTGARTTKQVTTKSVTRVVFWIHDNAFCSAEWGSDVGGAPVVDRTIEQVLASVKYAE